MRRTLMTLVAVAALGAVGCGEAEWVEGLDEPGAEQAGERAEEIAEERMDRRDETDPLSEEIREEIAEERAELATDVGADPSAMNDEEARTAAGHLAAGEGDAYGNE